MSEFSRERQIEIFVKGLGGKRPKVPVDMQALKAAAKDAMSEEAFAYVAGAAGTENTMHANRDGFGRWKIVPRMLTDISAFDTSVTLFGDTIPSPFLLAPIGVLDLAHKDADRAVGRAAAEEGIPLIISNQASVPMEECVAEMGDSPRWFQLYWSKMDDVVESMVQRAEDSGCSAIVVTLDATLPGWRIRDLDLASLPFLKGRGIAQYTSDPVFMDNLIDQNTDVERSITFNTLKSVWEMVSTHPGNALNNLLSGKAIAAIQTFIATFSRTSLTWDDLDFLRQHTSLPILLKGILHPDDARKAVDYGMDGIIVSNHGGRQIDGSISAIDALPDVVDNVGNAIPVLMDSGIRSGADIFKALALGAEAVCLGRPYVYGLAAGGYEGVREVIRNFKADFELTMRLTGCRSIDEITPDLLKYV